MKKYILIASFFSFILPVCAQNADALVATEIAFEKSCLEKGIRDGFLAYVDSNGIMLTKKAPVNARQFWSSLPSFEGVFNWSPSYAEMCLSGDWGYTTGNFEHRPKKSTDTANESGQYSTVWHKTSHGEWKFLFDIGNPHPPAPLHKQSETISISKSPSDLRTTDTIPAEPEKAFIISFEQNIRDAYQKYGGTRYILSLTGHQAITSGDSAVILLGNMQHPIKYHPSGSFVSPKKDMLAVYGGFDADGEYLRIWRHEKDGWKIALEVIKP